MYKKLKKSEFNKNILTLMTGTTIAQAIPISITPILTRIYTPEDFGVFSLFIALSSIIAVISNGRYELAIMLPKKEENAVNVLFFGFLLTSFVSILLLIIIILFHNKIILLLDKKSLDIWLYFVPISVFLLGCFNLLNYYNSRKKQYKILAKANILRSSTLAVGQLGFSFFIQGGGALIIGQVLAQIVTNFTLLSLNIKQLSIISIKKIKIIALAKRYKDFPKFSLLAILAYTLSQHLTDILISSFYGIAVLGYYALIQRVLTMPALLIGASIGQVFYQTAVEEKIKTGTAMNSLYTTLKKLIFIAFPTFLVLYFIIEDIFAIVFGEHWRVAGEYAKILVPFYFIRFIVSPLSLMNQVNMKNKLSMWWQIGLLFLHLSIILFCKETKVDFSVYLNIVTLVISIYYIYLLFLIFQHTRINND